MAGTVLDRAATRLTPLLDQPAPGTAFVAVEGHGDQFGVSIWSCLYGTDAAMIATRDAPLWQQWLTDNASSVSMGQG